MKEWKREFGKPRKTHLCFLKSISFSGLFVCRRMGIGLKVVYRMEDRFREHGAKGIKDGWLDGKIDPSEIA